MLSRRALVGKLAACAAVGAGLVRTSLASTGSNSSSNSLIGSERGDSPRELAPQTSAPAVPAQSLPEMAADAHAMGVIDGGPQETASAPPPWELLRPLKQGAEVGHSWHVAALTGVVDGSCVLTLKNQKGREHRVHLCRNDGRPQGLVYTEQLDLVVMNGGQGDLPTEEGLAQAVAEVAHVVAANERGRQPVLATLLPHGERLELFSGPVDRRLR